MRSDEECRNRSTFTIGQPPTARRSPSFWKRRGCRMSWYPLISPLGSSSTRSSSGHELEAVPEPREGSVTNSEGQERYPPRDYRSPQRAPLVALQVLLRTAVSR